MLRDESAGVEATWCGVERETGYEQTCERLHRRLKLIVKARGALDAQEAAALREAEALRVWRHYGYGSLLEYMEMEMGYSPRAALERLRVAKAIVELPAIADAMAQGDLSFSAGRELTRVATADTEQAWLEAASDKNMRDVENLVSGRKQGDKPTDPVDPKLRTRRLRYDDVDEETVALLRQARQILEREHGERMSDCDFLRTYARMVIDGAASPQRSRAAHQVAITICSQCKRGSLDGGGLTAEMRPPSLEAALCDAEHLGHVDSVPHTVGATNLDADGVGTANDRAHADAAASTTHVGVDHAARAKQDIPPAMRRKVLARDHGRCRVPWCRSSRNVDLHHLTPLSAGGNHSLDNLIALCESHHLAHHAGGLVIEGDAATATFTRRAHNSFTIAKHAVDTAAALKSLGFDRREVAAAMEKTRAHVGTAELTLEQWIKIALGYCPKPRA